jgi:hypothetical protein
MCGMQKAFGILKQSFQKILYKIDLDITLVLDMFSSCCLLHNLILGWKKLDILKLLHFL